MSHSRFRTLDVRPLLKSGAEPFSAIREAVDALKPNEGLILISPFIPSPLIDLLKNEGFSAHPERQSDGSWQTIFDRTR
jgi:uncharacterized protein (DUF2249 family)